MTHSTSPLCILHSTKKRQILVLSTIYGILFNKSAPIILMDGMLFCIRLWSHLQKIKIAVLSILYLTIFLITACPFNSFLSTYIITTSVLPYFFSNKRMHILHTLICIFKQIADFIRMLGRLSNRLFS
jgi:hypothetical protein